MKIQIASDLHFEFRHDGGREFINSLPVAADVLVLAGDVHLAVSLRSVMRQFAAKWSRVIAVTGEREYFHSDPSTVVREIMAIESELPNVAYLHNGSSITIKGQRFIGGTLWFPHQTDNALYQGPLADFNSIRNFVPWVYEANRSTVRALRENLSPDDVLITHHLPSKSCLHPRYRGTPLERFFVSPIDDIILAKQPKLAICGHTHAGVDVSIGRTRVVCNPLGYPREGAHKFDPAYVLDV